MTSPCLMPAAAAAPPGAALVTVTPSGWREEFTCVSPTISNDARPDLVTLPLLISCRPMFVAVFAGIANPMPAAGPPMAGSWAVRVGIPRTRPESNTSAPPLLPGLMAALVCRASTMTGGGFPWTLSSVTVRPVAETIPWVTLSIKPYGAPIASTIWPTCACAELAQRAGLRALAPSVTLMTARSSGAKMPISLAFSDWLVVETLTTNFLALPTTCALVTMLPCRSSTTPEPVDWPASISTTDGSTREMVDWYLACSGDLAALSAFPAEQAAMAALAAVVAAPTRHNLTTVRARARRSTGAISHYPPGRKPRRP